MKKILVVVFACLIMLSVVATPVSAWKNGTAFEGTVTMIAGLDPGKQWISEDGVFHIRNAVELYEMEVDDTRLTGELTLTFSANFHFAADPDVLIYGPIRGRVYLENDEGYWEGNNVGERTEEGFNYLTSVLHGHGAYEGLQARIDFIREEACLYCDFDVHGVVK